MACVSTDGTKNLNSDEGTSMANKKHCRLCAKQQGSIYIFSKNERASKSLKEQISLCTQVEVYIDDGLPSWLCSSCSRILASFYHFRKQCHAAQKQLQKIFHICNDIKIEIHSDAENFENDSVMDSRDIDTEDEDNLERLDITEDQIKIELEIRNEESVLKDVVNGNDKTDSIKEENHTQSAKIEDDDCMHNPNADKLESHLNCKNNDCWSVVLNNIDLDIVKDEIENSHKSVTVDESGKVCNPKLDTGHSLSANEDEQSLKKNFKVEYKDSKEIFCCCICGKCLKSKLLAKKHLKSKCDKKSLKLFKRKRKRVYQSKREPLKPNESDVDDEECIKIDGSKEIFKCKYCSRIFKSRICLRKHKNKRCKKNANINYSRIHMCDYCGSAFNLRSILVQHMRRHSAKKFSCEICGKRFTRSSHVHIHMRIHNNYKPFVCETCGRSFTKSSDLLRHKRIHSDARNYKCPVCPRTFKRSGDVTCHLRVHTGDKPYKCEPCSKAYTNYSSLRKHRLNNCTAKKGSGNVEKIQTAENKSSAEHPVAETQEC